MRKIKIISGKFETYVTVLWCSKTEITDGTGILVLVRVLWDIMISKIYWHKFQHSFFKNAHESRYYFNPTEIMWSKNGTFSLVETSVNGNVTFAYIMTFYLLGLHTFPYLLENDFKITRTCFSPAIYLLKFVHYVMFRRFACSMFFFIFLSVSLDSFRAFSVTDPLI